ncbi:MAG: flagellar hook-length control protein FliK [Armatimonadota bacterium]
MAPGISASPEAGVVTMPPAQDGKQVETRCEQAFDSLVAALLVSAPCVAPGSIETAQSGRSERKAMDHGEAIRPACEKFAGQCPSVDAGAFLVPVPQAAVHPLSDVEVSVGSSGRIMLPAGADLPTTGDAHGSEMASRFKATGVSLREWYRSVSEFGAVPAPGNGLLISGESQVREGVLPVGAERVQSPSPENVAQPSRPAGEGLTGSAPREEDFAIPGEKIAVAVVEGLAASSPGASAVRDRAGDVLFTSGAAERPIQETPADGTHLSRAVTSVNGAAGKIAADRRIAEEGDVTPQRIDLAQDNPGVVYVRHPVPEDTQRGVSVVRRLEAPGVEDIDAVKPNAHATGVENPSLASASGPDRRFEPLFFHVPRPGAPVHNEVVDRLSSEIVRAASLRVVEGRTGLDIRLDPPQLGTVRVNIFIEHGNLTASIQTTTESARQILQSGLDDLKAALTDQGINVQSLSVSVNSQSYQGWHAAADAHTASDHFLSGQTPRLNASPEIEEQPEDPVGVLRADRSSVLDYLA